MTEQNVTLEEMLMARELRRENQRVLIENFGTPLISFTLNTPGPVKMSDRIEQCFEEGVSIIEEVLRENGINIIFSQKEKRVTGCEYYGVADCEALPLKRLLTEIEDNAPLGRLYDIDVIGDEGRPVGRSDIGMQGRKCLMCDRDAHECARSRRHSVQELADRMNAMIDENYGCGDDSWKDMLYKQLIRKRA